MSMWLVDFSGVDRSNPDAVPTIGTMAVQADSEEEAVRTATEIAAKTIPGLPDLSHIATGEVKAAKLG